MPDRILESLERLWAITPLPTSKGIYRLPVSDIFGHLNNMLKYQTMEEKVGR